ncbi:MAG: alkaline phosphatase D family protein [Synechococcales cyanobacterium]
MPYSRRFALQLLAAGGASSILLAACSSGSPTAFQASQGGRFPNSVWSGDPTESSIVLSTRYLPGDGVTTATVTLQVATDAAFTNVVLSETLTVRLNAGANYRTEPGDFIARAVVTGLTPGQVYFFRFLGEGGVASPVGRTRTLPNDGRPLTFLHISCANEPPYPIGSALLADAANAEFVSFNGDTVYADRFWLGQQPDENLEFYRGLYRDQRSPAYAGADFARIFEQVPVVINWDDHEVIDNYSGQKAIGGSASQLDDATGAITDVENLKTIGYQAFFEYNPITPTLTDVAGVEAQDRLFRSFRCGTDVEVFVLDLRQYRELAARTPILPILPPGLSREAFLASSGLTLTPAQQELLFGPAGVPEAFWINELRQRVRPLMGDPQKNWLLNGLRNSTARFKFVISEFPITITYFRSNDVWEGYGRERQEVLDFIENNGIQNVIFLTGNNHAGFIGQVNPGGAVPIWEVWAGPTGRSVTAISLNEAGQALGLPNGAEVYYGILNTFLAPGASPISTGNLRFLELAQPNYTSIQVNGGSVTIQVKGVNGQVLTDPLGRRGEITLPA